MGAYSVTSAGSGSAFPGNKGPGNGREQFQTIFGAHVIAAGSVSHSNASPVPVTTVTLAEESTYDSSRYAVLLTNDEEGSPYVTNKTDVDGKFASFDINGVGEIDWVVIRKG